MEQQHTGRPPDEHGETARDGPVSGSDADDARTGASTRIGTKQKYPPLSERTDKFRELNGRIGVWVVKYLMEHKRLPTATAVGREFGMTAKWAKVHLYYLSDYTQHLDDLRALTPTILSSFGARVVAKGRAVDVLTWLKIMHGFIDPALVPPGINPSHDDMNIGKLTAEDEQLRDLEAEYWERLARRAQESTGDTPSHSG